MLNIARTPLVAASLVGFAMVVATIAVAQDNSGSAAQPSGQPSASTQPASTQPDGAQAGTSSTQPSANATKDTNLPQSQSSTTQQQANAPVSDPEKAAQTAAGAKAAGSQSSTGRAADAQDAAGRNANMSKSSASQRYETRRPAGDNAGSDRGGASLGVNVVSSDDGQGVVVARVRPGTPADQIGLQQRDRIISLNGKPVAGVDEFISTVRGMNPGDQVQLSIDRAGNTRNISGRLEALRDTLAAGEGPAGNIVGRDRDNFDRGRSGDNMQTSYEERSRSDRSRGGDYESRISRIEQQLDQLTRDITEIRKAVMLSQASSSPQQSGSSQTSQPSGTTSSGGSQQTPGQSPSDFQPPSR